MKRQLIATLLAGSVLSTGLLAVSTPAEAAQRRGTQWRQRDNRNNWRRSDSWRRSNWRRNDSWRRNATWWKGRNYNYNRGGGFSIRDLLIGAAVTYAGYRLYNESQGR